MDEKKKVLEDVDTDRRYAIDAAIVRTMKSRKVLPHQQLVLEVVQQLTKMFKPDFKIIKKRIEDLISPRLPGARQGEPQCVQVRRVSSMEDGWGRRAKGGWRPLPRMICISSMAFCFEARGLLDIKARELPINYGTMTRTDCSIVFLTARGSFDVTFCFRSCYSQHTL